MKYSFHSLAQKELREAIDCYDECQNGLGIEFATEVYNAIQIVLQFSQAWSSLSKNTKCCITNRFPYGIIHQILEVEGYNKLQLCN